MYFPEFGADLVTALAGLDVNEFAHFWKSLQQFDKNKNHSMIINTLPKNKTMFELCCKNN